MLDRREFIKFALGALAGRAAQRLPGAVVPGVYLSGRGRVSRDRVHPGCNTRETGTAAEMVRPLVGDVLAYDELCEIGESVDIADGWEEALVVGRVTLRGSLGQAWVHCSIDMNKAWAHVRAFDVYGGAWSTKDKGETWQRIR